jgi:Receptor L domain
MQRKLVLLFLLIFSLKMRSETVFGSFVFTIQQDVDLFFVENPLCDTIVGSIEIVPQNNGSADDIINLSGLQNIKVITGDLTISMMGNSDSSPLSLLGLSSLEEVNGNLAIFDHHVLQNIQSMQGLENLNTCGSLLIQNCYAITTLEPLYQLQEATHIYCLFTELIPKSLSLINLFPNLESIPGDIAFEGASYPEFSGFNNLLYAGSISIAGYNQQAEIGIFNAFPILQNSINIRFEFINIDQMSGFDELQSCTFLTLHINSSNPLWNFNSLNTSQEILLKNLFSCESTPTFPNLTTLDAANGGIRIEGLFDTVHFASLQSTGYFDVLGDGVGNGPTNIICPNLFQIHGDIIIAHTLILDLNFLDNVNILGALVSIVGNFNLSACNEDVLCYKIANEPLNVTIALNAPGCNDPLEVSVDCNLASAAGTVFIDLDCDGILNGEEYSYPFSSILQNQNGIAIELVNPNDTYQIPLSQNAQTITLITPQGFTSTSSYTYSSETQQNYTEQNYALCPEDNLYNLSIVLIPITAPRPGFTSSYHVQITNLGVNESTGEINIDFSDALGLSVLSVSDNGTINNNIVSWPASTLGAFQSITHTIQTYIDTTVPLGQEIITHSNVDIISPAVADSYPENNQHTLQQTVVGSYDPNDISVNKENINEEEILSGAPIELEYIIRFQNTGTASAINIRIENFLDPILNISSINVIATSHNHLIEIDENNKLIWTFDNINLPDSNSDEPMSHGYIVYRISTFNNLLVTDSITNYANIFFDFNLPITTNTALTSFYNCPSPLTALGDTEFCEGEEINLATDSNYNLLSWSVDSLSNGTGNNIQITGLDAGNHIITLEGESAFCSDQLSWTISVIATPEAPQIEQNGNTLTASGDGLFYWEFNGNDLNENTSSIEISESGIYSVTLTSGGCTSAATSGNFTIISIENLSPRNGFYLYPNPTESQNNIAVVSNIGSPIIIKLYDLSERLIYESSTSNNMLLFDDHSVQRGMYIVRGYDQNNNDLGTQKLIVN